MFTVKMFTCEDAVQSNLTTDRNVVEKYVSNRKHYFLQLETGQDTGMALD